MIRSPAFLLLSALVANPALAAEVHIQSSGPVIELTVSEQVKEIPDMATISAGVSSEAQTAVRAMADNAAAMRTVIARIKQLGIDEDGIQTAGITLNARYDYDRGSQRQVFRGYAVSNRVTVVLRDVARTGRILDALVAAGATDIGGPSFSMADDTGAQALARKAALATAQTRAMEYAGWAGYSDIRLLEISEAVSSHHPMPMMNARSMDTAMSAPTPVQPGLVGTGVTVRVKYEMTAPN